MKVVHLSTYDVAGGAAIAAYRLHRSLIDTGVDSKMLVKERSSQDQTVETLPPQPVMSLTRRLLSERWGRYLRELRTRDGMPEGLISDCHAPYRPVDFKAIADADVVHLHWTSGMLDWPSVLPWLGSRKPIVWTLHDMNPFLGTQHYHAPSETLRRSFARWDRAILEKKRQGLAEIPGGRLQFVAPSRWIKNEAETSGTLDSYPVRYVPNGIGNIRFRPLKERAAIRRALGIPEDRFVIGFVAQSMAETRKGIRPLMAALQSDRLAAHRITLLCVGADPPPMNHVPAIHLGSFQSEPLMALFYNALDIFVCPSLADNLPNTVLEAMACGVPTVAFAAGGIPEMVRPDETGWLAERIGDPNSLSEAIHTAIRDMGNADVYRRRCEDLAGEEYSLAVQAATMVRVYQDSLTSFVGDA